ncbi:uncharacterized protein [Triticum aestivum]|uniref:uncharacterized protein n=1 Tax=Triticum aestivum TaxID=4565 RepID=UPI001D02B5F2|nr:uncharacterized protein LOC123073941 [Triticum aestivum]
MASRGREYQSLDVDVTSGRKLVTIFICMMQQAQTNLHNLLVLRSLPILTLSSAARRGNLCISHLSATSHGEEFCVRHCHWRSFHRHGPSFGHKIYRYTDSKRFDSQEMDCKLQVSWGF